MDMRKKEKNKNVIALKDFEYEKHIWSILKKESECNRRIK
jgi:hypothetical protein